MAHHSIIPINEGWTFRVANDDDPNNRPRPVAGSRIPTTIHQDLLSCGLINDPFYGKNEETVQWVGHKDWLYAVSFEGPEIPTNATAVLAFDGLDTFAEVRLNGSIILTTSNMFTPERVAVGDLLKLGSNLLEITFQSACRIGRELVQSDRRGNFNYICSNGDLSRLPSRKAQYHWGWDWGPKLVTCGPWRPIHLEVYHCRISDLQAEAHVDDRLSFAAVTARATIEGNATTVDFSLFVGDQLISRKTKGVESGGRQVYCIFDIDEPKLWYPNGYGKQPLYRLTATLLVHGQRVGDWSKNIGLRRVELVQCPLDSQPGRSFYFRINNIPIFCGGSNWIPADSFLPRISKERYRAWVKLAADGNQCMLRVWGGGVYEDEAFYDACDEMGILVWQDFMFACGNYPGTPQFLESVAREARANVLLLRHHPSIVIWAGNNEDYQIAEDAGLTYDYADKNPKNWLRSNFPARYIYEKILKEICEELVPETPYHYGSPWSPGGKSSDPTIGDIHQWNVWHGTQEPYQNWDKLVGRFVSEFGMQACPSTKTLRSFTSSDSDRRPTSSTMDFHNKAFGHVRRLASYVAENVQINYSSDFEFMYGTQLVQAGCLASAYRVWRREWRGEPSRVYCGGALVWQMNDCWPGISWSICDYYLQPKAAYYAIKRELKPTTIGIKRVVYDRSKELFGTNPEPGDQSRPGLKFEIWGSSFSSIPQTFDCVVKIWAVETSKLLFSGTVIEGFTLLPNQSTEVKEVYLDEIVPSQELKGTKESFHVVVAAYLRYNDVEFARCVDWPDPLRHIGDLGHMVVPFFKLLDRRLLQITAKVPYKGVLLQCEEEDISFSDNMVDLTPDETYEIEVTGLKEQELRLTVHFLGCTKGVQITVPLHV